MIHRPWFLPEWFLDKVLLFNQCGDCKKWAYWRRMSMLNPFVCEPCMFDRQLMVIEMEARMRVWTEAIAAMSSIYVQRNKERRAERSH